jgi:hypothetical protein
MYVFAIMHYTPVLIFFVILLYLHCVKYFLLVYPVSLSVWSFFCAHEWFHMSTTANALRGPQCDGIMVNEIILFRI